MSKVSKLRNSVTRDTGWRHSPLCWLTSDYASCPRTSGVAPRHCAAAVVCCGKIVKKYLNVFVSLLAWCAPGGAVMVMAAWFIVFCPIVYGTLSRLSESPNQSDVMMGNSEDNVVMIRHYLPCFPKMKLQFRSINLSTKRRAASHPGWNTGTILFPQNRMDRGSQNVFMVRKNAVLKLEDLFLCINFQ